MEGKKSAGDVSDLLKKWKIRSKSTTNVGISKRPENAAIIAAPGQRRIFSLQHQNPENPFYQYGHRIEFKQKVEPKILVQSLEKVMGNQECLRSNFFLSEGELQVKINENRPVPIIISGKEYDSQEAEKFCLSSYSLENDDLIRLLLFTGHPSHDILVIGMHHIIGDRWSLDILIEEWATAYHRIQDDPSNLTNNSIGYYDYTFWLSRQNKSDDSLKYWKEIYKSIPPNLKLPGYQTKKNLHRGKIIQTTLPFTITNQLKEISKDLKTTLYPVILSGFHLMLSKHTGEMDFAVGSPVITRDRKELHTIIGFFNDTIAHRLKVDTELTLRQFLLQSIQIVSEDITHKSTSFDNLVKAVNPPRETGVNPIFQVMYVHNSYSPKSDLRNSWIEKDNSLDLGISKFDISLFSNDQLDKIELILEYNSGRYDDAIMQSFMQRLAHTFDGFSTHLDTPVGQIEYLTLSEINRYRNLLRGPSIGWDDKKSIFDYIQIHDESAIALIDAQDRFTYGKLIKSYHSIASALLKHGLKSGEGVVVITDQSVHTILAFLGIARAGGYYIPIDRHYPAGRIQYMLEDASIIKIIAVGDIDLDLPVEVQVYTIQELLDMDDIEMGLPELDTQDDIYCIYTSGSTGKPKGIPINHQNLVHSTLARSELYNQPVERFLLLSSFSFDSSVAGIYSSLIDGGCLVIPPFRIEQDVKALSDWVWRHKITHMLLLPSLYQILLDLSPSERLHTLKLVMVAGEACPYPVVEKHHQVLPSAVIYNEYGPSEATVWCIAAPLKPNENKHVPIGHPIMNTEAWVLNEMHNLVPPHTAGELYISGPNLSRGYFLNSAETARSYIHRSIDGQLKRLYKTGDLVKYDDNGQLFFLGRKDQQVKIRGFRIEIQEIEAAIRKFIGVRQVAIKVERKPKATIVAFYTSSEPIERKALATQLADQLPDYMVPDRFIQLDEFPFLPNGKIDLNKIQIPDLIRNTSSTFTQKSRITSEEEVLIDIWKQCLGIEDVGTHDNFFSLGGDSLKSIQMLSMAREQGLHLLPDVIFKHQTIVTLAASISATPQASPSSLDDEIKEKGLSTLQKGYLINYLQNGIEADQVSMEFTITGQVDEPKIEAAIHQLYKAHPILTIVLDQKDNQIVQKYSAQPPDFQIVRNDSALNDDTRLLDLFQAPTNLWTFYLDDQDDWTIYWTTHHIFLDAWSCRRIIDDFLLILSGQPILKGRSFFSYLDWLERFPVSAARRHWRDQLDGVSTRPLIKQKIILPSFGEIKSTMSSETVKSLKDYCQLTSVSPGNFFQTIYGWLLAKVFNREEVLVGNTVSGRFASLDGIQQVSGLLMNVIPTRIKREGSSLISVALRELDASVKSNHAYEYTSVSQISEWINWPLGSSLIMCLYTYGSYLDENTAVGNYMIDRFSGDYSSRYPLTLRINPSKVTEINWLYDRSYLPDETVQLMSKIFDELIDKVVHQKVENVQELLEGVPGIVQEDTVSEPNKFSINHHPISLTLPSIIELYNRVLDIRPIGESDSFFDLGGTSLQALQFLGTVEKELDKKIEPFLFFQNDTPKSFYHLIQQEFSHTSELIIQMNEIISDRPNLYCFHGGGGHILFYRDLAIALSGQYNVFSIQPPKVDNGDFPTTIHDLAAIYKKAILEGHPDDRPIHLLGTCFSNAVVVELCQQFEKSNDLLGKIFIVDSGPMHLFGNEEVGQKKTLARFLDMARRGDYSNIWKKIKKRIKPHKKQLQLDSEIVQSQVKQDTLDLIQKLNGLYALYDWNPIDQDIYFIRSTEFAARKDKNYQVDRWKSLTTGHLHIEIIPGDHTRLFNQSQVGGIADVIGKNVK